MQKVLHSALAISMACAGCSASPPGDVSRGEDGLAKQCATSREAEGRRLEQAGTPVAEGRSTPGTLVRLVCTMLGGESSSVTDDR